MAYLIGTDEAGYGPFLGPLVIAASVWEVPDVLQDLRAYFAEDGPSPGLALPVVMDDSKRVYQRHRGLRSLEHTVLPALASTLAGTTLPASWRSFWARIAPGSEVALEQLPWYRDFEVPLPVSLETDVLEEVTSQLRELWDRAEIRLLRLEAVAIFPPQFNDQLDIHGGKGGLLTWHTLDLVRRMLDTLEEAPVLIECDKHGGRNYYAPALQEVFPGDLLEVRQESRLQSVYRWGPRDQRREIRFTAKGDSSLPAGLASMTAKYLRELAMQAFNAYWCQRQPSLRPTAGYPADARRFRDEIAALLAAEQVPDRQLWRNR